jgi:hypothetical protein
MTPDSVEIKFSKYGAYKYLKGKKIVKINLLDNHRDYADRWDFSATKMIFLEREIQRLQFTTDTNSVLKIEFGYSNSYAEFIHIMNLNIVYEIRHAFLDNCFYLVPNPPPANPDHYDYDYDYLIPAIDLNNGPTFWERLNWWLDEQIIILPILFKHNYLLISGFILLIILLWILKIKSLTKRITVK